MQASESSQNCRQHCRARRISSDTDHHVGSKLPKYSAHLHTARGKIEHRLNPSSGADIFESAYFYQSQWKFSRGHKTVLDSPGSPDEKHFCVVIVFKFLRDGKAGDYVSSRPPARDNCPHAVTINRNRLDAMRWQLVVF